MRARTSLCALCVESPQAKASEQVRFIPPDRLPAGLFASGNVFHLGVFRVNDSRMIRSIGAILW